MTVSKNRQHFDFKNFLIRCILDYAQPHLVDFWKKRPANFNFIWLEWNSYNSSIQIHIVWSRSSIFKLKSSPAQGWQFRKCYFSHSVCLWTAGVLITLECGINMPARLLILKLFSRQRALILHSVFIHINIFDQTY